MSADDGLSSALESILSEFAGMVRRVGWRYRLSEVEIDEVMQEVRIRLWRAQGESEQIAHSSASYVYRTAVSAALDLMRRRRARRMDQTVSLDDETADVAAASDPVEDVESAELKEQVMRAMETIPASRRPVVKMYLAGYPREEIATLMGWTEAKTRNLLYRGLADLRERLGELGVA